MGWIPGFSNGGSTGAARNIRDLGSPTYQHTAIRQSGSRRGEGSSSALSQSALRIQSLSRQRKSCLKILLTAGSLRRYITGCPPPDVRCWNDDVTPPENQLMRP